MKVELNFYKPSGKWYAKQTFYNLDIDLIENFVITHNLYPTMDYTVHIVESDGFLTPYRMFKR